ncbi:hypothetical protein N7462_010675 [Penicillium macrosclerotiorum]|uniref:uncharacterized protein n=1 Tax=Penicillium macrosclerotiorum TaxID=303699 RepID=UPI0025474DEF|nr:uncharacterized protein N7462_010675 [Penicillium macrosclerotiorum]KAJ5669605.1 hypothetical protein N7462_010675 [Penicillium macrosclerotiorum]
MAEEETPRETPEDTRGDDNQHSASKSAANQAAKDRKCQYCHQAFTSSSLGRHLDQFLFKKKPDGVHDVEEIRRIRSGITRRQARTTSGKRDGSPERASKKGHGDSYTSVDSASKSRDAPVRMMFNTPTWHATGVINDIPNPNRTMDGPRLASSQSRSGPSQLPDFASRGSTANNPDTMKALELALREVLDNIKAATSRFRPPMSPFDFDIQSQSFPSLCLQLLPPPPSLFAAHPFPSPTSFPLQPPGSEHLDIVRQALRSKISQWQSDQIAAESLAHSRPVGGNLDHSFIYRTAQQHEEMALRHMELAFDHWNRLSSDTRCELWQLETTRAFAREVEKRKSVDEQLARVQQEANQLRAQVERLGSCQWPREFALFPPDTLPISRDVARELDTKESHISPNSSRWDYDNVVAKWKRVVMHDKSMGRIGVGHANTNTSGEFDSLQQRDSPDLRPPRPGEDTSSHPNRLRPLQNTATMSPDPAAASTPASSIHYASPYSHADTRSPPGGAGAGSQAKRPRLMNGSDSSSVADPSAVGKPLGPSLWPSSTPILSNLAAPSGHTPPGSSRG